MALVVVTQGLILAAQQTLKPEVRELRIPLAEMPQTFGEWRGEPAELDSQIFDKLEADQAISRAYTNSDGRPIGFHSAVWFNEPDWTPHTPTVCYPASGWSMREGRTVTLERNPDARVRIQKFTRRGITVTTLYWYQIGDITYGTRDEALPVQLNLWGQETRPPLIKVLMQATHERGANPEAELLELADQVYAWTSEL